MKLSKLISHLFTHRKIPEIDINSIQFKSTLVRKGDVFIAIKGYNEDGHNYIKDSILNGAVAVIGEKDIKSLSVPYFQVKDSREALGQIAAIYYNHPSSVHNMIGITGTNGKTTTAYMVRHLLQSSQKSCSLISTVTNYINGMELIATATTPDALELQRILSLSSDEFAVMEVSSHGLDQKRVEGIHFDFGIFTNLSHEHLDYHHDLDQYFKIKSELFYRLKPQGEAIVNSSSPWGTKLIEKLRSDGIPVFTFGKSPNDTLQLHSYDGNSIINVSWQGERLDLKLNMPGIYNVQNALAAILVALRIGINFQSIKNSFETFTGVPGRFEVYKHSSGVTFIVDYAHTPDGLENFLKTVRTNHDKKLIHIFGFRGKKDLSKRKFMLQTSVFYSDEVILTIDDLNGVEKENMVSELYELSNRWGKGKTRIIVDRTKAIEYAWENASDEDYIVVTGKGPETYMEHFALPTETDEKTIKFLFAKQASHS
ncbi:UDP-N-acetylmuramoyl-L-alanyl-D-glutamate--2,6-diaminopimelate ligase [Cytobacillus sp. S13-E01]|uniref:UDP-N-acetylmuramoyl-L-alanyl-D-glutamate--2, 6-diaminopimelate ligase n=1 Tax=Cytobacillus sp. S13-E01 TaxID=3031326 RepID=UPI0023D7C4F0|nr:UDP-N-acetylmuramoyl-L-alanyl-D-glutamate--2,6-diaminopimelate ligase [Cytobacillus sp. S13-E01]MDF0728860.1 UDP-N-acetylmuramoyl-L-alanyl-D-glutamate--2,6-diaminopimelate ligase [Cytobacillus sp. S13-E01]